MLQSFEPFACVELAIAPLDFSLSASSVLVEGAFVDAVFGDLYAFHDLIVLPLTFVTMPYEK